jgi:hypothetical protein
MIATADRPGVHIGSTRLAVPAATDRPSESKFAALQVFTPHHTIPHLRRTDLIRKRSQVRILDRPCIRRSQPRAFCISELAPWLRVTI